MRTHRPTRAARHAAPALAAALALALLGCGGGDEIRRADDLGPLEPGRDAVVVPLDGGSVDGAADAGLPILDAEALDGAALDGDTPDGKGPPPDGDVPDGDVPDGDLPDGDLPDGGPPGQCPEGMALVPAGDFPFGAEGDLRFLPDFCVDRTEVTAGDYLACADDGACDGYANWSMCLEMDPRRPHQCRPDRLDHPANWIDWFRAEQYCRWAGKRLPDEGRWEKAATGVDGRIYPWGDGINCRDAHLARGDPFDNCLGIDGRPDLPVAVDSYADNPGPYGALNMVGNVREWLDLRLDRDVLPADDEMGVAKGGDWRSAFDQAMNADRDGTLAVSRSSQGHGFRCVLDLP